MRGRTLWLSCVHFLSVSEKSAYISYSHFYSATVFLNECQVFARPSACVLKTNVAAGVPPTDFWSHGILPLLSTEPLLSALLSLGVCGGRRGQKWMMWVALWAVRLWMRVWEGAKGVGCCFIQVFWKSIIWCAPIIWSNSPRRIHKHNAEVMHVSITMLFVLGKCSGSRRRKHEGQWNERK